MHLPSSTQREGTTTRCVFECVCLCEGQTPGSITCAGAAAWRSWLLSFASVSREHAMALTKPMLMICPLSTLLPSAGSAACTASTPGCRVILRLQQPATTATAAGAASRQQGGAHHCPHSAAAVSQVRELWAVGWAVVGQLLGLQAPAHCAKSQLSLPTTCLRLGATAITCM